MIKKNLPHILMFISATTGLITATSIQALNTELVTEKLLFTEEEKSLVAQNIQIPNFQIQQFNKPTLFNSSGVAGIRGHSYYYDPLKLSLRNSIYSAELDARDVLKITVEGGLDHVVQIFDVINETDYKMLYINNGSTATLLIPPGKYIIKCAIGKTWYGDQELFGQNSTYYYKLDEVIDSKDDKTSYTTYSLTLHTSSDILPENAVNEQQITKSEFEPPIKKAQ